MVFPSNVFRAVMILLILSVHDIRADTGSTMSDGCPNAESSTLQLINQESLLRLTLDKQLQDLRTMVFELQSKMTQLDESCQSLTPTKINNFESDLRALASNVSEDVNRVQHSVSENKVELENLRQIYLTGLENEDKLNDSYQNLSAQISEMFAKLEQSILGLRVNFSSAQGSANTELGRRQAIYFSAHLSNGFTTTNSNEVIKFDKVETNVGNAYNPGTGSFTCPRAGTYWLSFGFTNCSSKGFYMKLVINGIDRMRGLAASSRPNNSVERGFFFSLNKGDAVQVRAHEIGSEICGGHYKYITFSGMYISDM